MKQTLAGLVVGLAGLEGVARYHLLTPAQNRLARSVKAQIRLLQSQALALQDPQVNRPAPRQPPQVEILLQEALVLQRVLRGSPQRPCSVAMKHRFQGRLGVWSLVLEREFPRFWVPPRFAYFSVAISFYLRQRRLPPFSPRTFACASLLVPWPTPS